MNKLQNITTYDLIIVGAGPAGLSAGYYAKQYGLSFLILEKGVIAQTVYNYPIGKSLFSTPNEIEIVPDTLHPKEAKPTREEVLSYYYQFALHEHELSIHTKESVNSVQKNQNVFLISTDKANYLASYILVATGGFGIPKKLNIPGENNKRVSYRFVEAYPFAGQKVLVVGGGNSAAEAALYLHEEGARVTLSIRRPTLAPLQAEVDKIGIKPWVRKPLEQLIANKQVQVIYSSQIIEILSDRALLKTEDSTDLIPILCEHIFALIGADPDVSLLKQAGVEIASDGRPVYNPTTYETRLKGLFVVGHLTRELHMKNATIVPPKIIKYISQQIAATTKL